MVGAKPGDSRCHGHTIAIMDGRERKWRWWSTQDHHPPSFTALHCLPACLIRERDHLALAWNRFTRGYAYPSSRTNNISPLSVWSEYQRLTLVCQTQARRHVQGGQRGTAARHLSDMPSICRGTDVNKRRWLASQGGPCVLQCLCTSNRSPVPTWTDDMQ